MFNIGKVGSDAYDRGRIQQKTGSWEIADGVGALLKKPEDHNAGDKLSLGGFPDSSGLLDLLKR